jgi:hypothetical protein
MGHQEKEPGMSLQEIWESLSSLERAGLYLLVLAILASLVLYL